MCARHCAARIDLNLRVGVFRGDLLTLRMSGFVCGTDGDIGRVGAGMAVRLWDMTGRSSDISAAAACNKLAEATIVPSWCAVGAG